MVYRSDGETMQPDINFAKDRQMKIPVENILISEQTTILRALEVIDQAALEIALVVDENKALIGTLTDGDIRRGLIRGNSLQTAVRELMNPSPQVASQSTPDDELLFMMTNRSIKQLPVIDHKRRVIRLVTLQELITLKPRDNIAIIMAGGKGTRLGDLTRNTPKPLLSVGSRPIIATIVEQLRRHGIRNIYISVNYHAQLIKDYFTQNPVDGVDLKFIEEENFMGTAGSLSLLDHRPEEPLLVMNGDILSPVNFANLIEYHKTAAKALTVCTREFSFQIPYGVLHMRGDELIDIDEKPSQNIFINAGIYVLEPKLLDFIPKDRRYDMPELIKRACKMGKGVNCYPVSEFWLDIGNPQDYNKANREFARISEDHE